jgi:hypothetical protein
MTPSLVEISTMIIEEMLAMIPYLKVFGIWIKKFNQSMCQCKMKSLVSIGYMSNDMAN